MNKIIAIIIRALHIARKLGRGIRLGEKNFFLKLVSDNTDIWKQAKNENNGYIWNDSCGTWKLSVYNIKAQNIEPGNASIYVSYQI